VVDKFSGASREAATGFDVIKTKAQEMGAAIGPAGTSVGDLGRTYSEAAQKAADLARAQVEFQDGMRASAAATREADAALAEHTNSQLAAFDATFAVAQAQRDFATALFEAETAAASGTASAGELQAAYDNETQAAEKTALAVQKKAEQDAIASGTALTAAQSNDVLIGALQGMADQASGPSKVALEALIAKLKETGAQHPEPTVELIDNATGKVKTAQQVLAEYGRTMSMAQIGVNDQATAKIREAIRLGQQFAGSSYVADATLITHNVARARGGPVRPGTPYTVGEQGVETFIPDVGGTIIPAGPTKKMLTATANVRSAGVNGAGGQVTIVHNHWDGTFIGPDRASIGRWIDEALAASRRRGNRAG
jgi:hypothetical protein